MTTWSFCLRVLVCALPAIPLAFAQDTDSAAILRRLDQLESENRKLQEEIADLRKQLAARGAEAAAPAPDAAAANTPTTEERLEVAERRIEELAQSKVSASQRLPLSITGMLLFNAFTNGRFNGNQQYPIWASPVAGDHVSGLSPQQTVLGLAWSGANLPGGGQATGSLDLYFYGEHGSSGLHIRTATLDFRWLGTTLSFAVDKPIFSPLNPDSLAQVSVPPLSSAGNLWAWQPQVKIQQRIRLGETNGLRLQGGVYQTADYAVDVPRAFLASQEEYRPGYEGRFEFWHEQAEKRFQIAPGFHLSTSHVAGGSVPSRLVSLDWLARPSHLIEFKGAWYDGENVAPLGSLDQGYTILGLRNIVPIHAIGGWAQVALFVSTRGTIHIYSGEEQDRATDLYGYGIGRNWVYAANYMYRLAPNVLAGLELSQTRTEFVNIGLRINNHYDLALAYLF